MRRHPVIALVVFVFLLLAILGARALRAQINPAIDVKAAADTARQLRVIVSLKERKLWVIEGTADTLHRAPVAVGSSRTLRSGARVWNFATPRGIRSVLSSEMDPVWIRPDWAYIELARLKKLRLDSVSSARPRQLSDGRVLVVRGAQVGTLRDSLFTPWPATDDIIIGGVLYLPPMGTPYRMQPGTLGHYRLNLGAGIGIHGTLDRESIGKAVTHGCMRLGDADIEWLYQNVPVGTLVFIY